MFLNTTWLRHINKNKYKRPFTLEVFQEAVTPKIDQLVLCLRLHQQLASRVDLSKLPEGECPEFWAFGKIGLNKS